MSAMTPYPKSRAALIFLLCGAILASSTGCSVTRTVANPGELPSDATIDLTTHSGRQYRFDTWHVVGDSLLVGTDQTSVIWLRIDSIKTISPVHDPTTTILKGSIMVLGIAGGTALLWYVVRAITSLKFTL